MERPATTEPLPGTSRATGRGTLHLIIGPMFSGKSTELLRHINRHRSIGKSALVVNHALNCRYGSKGVTTHDARRHDNCAVVTRLRELRPEGVARATDNASAVAANARAYAQTDTVFIEEVQFYPDALSEILHMVEMDGKTVVAAGLVSDYQRRPFGDVLALIPHADRIEHLRGLCSRCRNGCPGAFTLRTTNDTAQTIVAASDTYEVVCRQHYAAAIAASSTAARH